MLRNTAELLAGLFVLVGIITITALAVGIGGARITGADSYELDARFSDIGGLSAGSAVRVAGVSVGEVTEVHVDPKTFFALVTMRIPANLELSTDTYASIRTNGLIGEKYVSLSPGGAMENLESGDIIVDTESAVDLEGLISRFAFGQVEGESQE